MTESVRREPGSFRDPDAGVYLVGDRVLRVLRDQAASDWEATRRAPFLHAAVDDGRVVGTRTVVRDQWPDDIAATFGDDRVIVLEHDRVPVISYPFEWTFTMLRDAALLHLDLVLCALQSGFTTTDGTAYNVTFRGVRPQFIDVGSFVPYRGGAWNGYRQFCETFLNPLLIQAHTGVPFQPLLRGRLEGIRPGEARRLLGLARAPRRGVVRNVVLHDYLERNVRIGSQATGRDLARSGFGRELATSTIKALQKLVRSLSVSGTRTTWSDYRATCSYTDAETAEKEAYVKAVATEHAPRQVLDLGCNDARFSELVAPLAETVVACDFDAEVVDAAARRLRDRHIDNVLPLVVDLSDPSPALGWANVERPAFFDRVQPDLVLALALVHHLVITASVPLAAVVEWLCGLGPRIVVEFPHPEDPMVQRLLEQKPAGQHDDFQLAKFLSLLEARAVVEQQRTLTGGTRTLITCCPRGADTGDES